MKIPLIQTKKKKFKKLKDDNINIEVDSCQQIKKANPFLSADDLLNEVIQEDNIHTGSNNGILCSGTGEKLTSVAPVPDNFHVPDIKNVHVPDKIHEFPMPLESRKIKWCPMCDKKVRHSKVFFENNKSVQVFKCSNKKCIFVKKVEFRR